MVTGGTHVAREAKMSKDKKPRSKGQDMLPEYDFSGGLRGKYAKRYAEGTNVVVLDPDVAQVFPNAKSVNDVLRAIAAVVRQQSGGRL